MKKDKMNKIKCKQIQAGLLIATVIVWIVFGYLFLEGTWKEELEEQRNMTKWQYEEFDWSNMSIPLLNDSIIENSTNKTND